MKNVKILPGKTILRTLGIVLAVIFISSDLHGQKAPKKLRTRMSLEFFNNYDNTKTVKVLVYTIKDRKRDPVTNEKVIFYLGEVSDDNVLDSAFTDSYGIVQLDYPEQYDFPTIDDSNLITCSAEFKGSETHKAVSSEITFTEILMELFLTEVNQVKTLSVRAYEIGNENKLIPVEDVDVYFYVPRLFSDQKIGDGYISEGKSSIEFPENIAGDSIGNITVIARIEDHDQYGNVERQVSNFRWGNREPIEEDKALMTIEISMPTRGLWNSNAPIWMIITLIVLLTGVWGHYLFVTFQLVKLSRLKSRKTPR